MERDLTNKIKEATKRDGHKLAVLMSRKSHYAVILRRGPSQWFHVIKWNMETDALEYGAWFKGRIYQSKCDLSDNGELFLYSAFQGSKLASSYTDSYTALSKSPWLKGYALWPQGTTYIGGGEFQGSKDIGIWALAFFKGVHPDHQNTKGYSLVNLTTSDGWHKDHGLVQDADWSKPDYNGRIIWHKGYDIFVRINGQDNLLINLSDLKPVPNEAPY